MKPKSIQTQIKEATTLEEAEQAFAKAQSAESMSKSTKSRCRRAYYTKRVELTLP